MSIFNRALLAKLEVTKGVDSVPVAGTNDIQVVSLKPTPTAEIVDNPVVKATMGNKAHLIGRQTIEVAVDANMKASGVLGTAPELSPLLQACGLTETVVTAVSVDYAPSSVSGRKSVSAYAYDDGQVFNVLGAVSNLALDATIGQALKATFNLKAGFDIAPAVAAAPVPAVNATQPIVMLSADIITQAGAAIKAGAFKLDLGNEFGDHNTTGQNEFSVANRKPTITITKDSLSTPADWNALIGSTSIALVATFGTVAGNKIVITANNAQLSSVAAGERNEVLTTELAFNLYETAGDDQFNISFQ